MLFRSIVAAGASSVLALGLTAAASAASMGCTGTIYGSWVNDQGGVYIRGSWHADHTQICSVTEVWKGIPTEVCYSWIAKVDAAASTGKSVQVYYQDIPSCGTIPTYENSPAPYYVMLMNT